MAFCCLHLAKLEQRVRIALIKLCCFFKFCLGTRRVFLLIKQNRAQQVMESAAVGGFSELLMNGCNSFVHLLLRKVYVGDTP